MKENCSICRKELEIDTNIDTNYNLSWYHGQQPAREDIKILCENCYQAKEQWYLDNYERIWKETKENRLKFIKSSTRDCYAGKKDQNCQILKQRDCQHCQPWRSSLKKTCANCGKDISNQEITYSSKSSGEEEKFFCSLEHMNKYSKSEKTPKNNSENKGIPTEMKLFLGVLVVILVFIIGIALRKIWQKITRNKNIWPQKVNRFFVKDKLMNFVILMQDN